MILQVAGVGEAAGLGAVALALVATVGMMVNLFNGFMKRREGFIETMLTRLEVLTDTLERHNHHSQQMVDTMSEMQRSMIEMRVFLERLNGRRQG